MGQPEMAPASPRLRALTVATVSRSLALQSPEAWQVLCERGYAITFVAARDAWTERLLACNPGTGFREIRAERRLRPGTLFSLAGSLRGLSREEWDLVQVQSPIISAIWRLVATARSRQRTVYVVHGFHFQPGERSLRSGAVRLLEGVLANRTLALATVSVADHKFVRSLPRLLRPRILTALPGAGVPVEAHRAALSEERPLEAAYVLFVGDLNANKDPACAIEAVEACRGRGLALDLVVIGEGPLAGMVTEVALTRPWLHLVDRSDKVSHWMAHAGALLAPSHREGLPRVIIEALASGTPVIARDNRGSSELLAGGLGQTLKTGDPSDWADAIETALGSLPDKDAMWARAQDYGAGRFRAVYDDLIGQMEARRLDDLQLGPAADGRS